MHRCRSHLSSKDCLAAIESVSTHQCGPLDYCRYGLSNTSHSYEDVLASRIAEVSRCIEVLLRSQGFEGSIKSVFSDFYPHLRRHSTRKEYMKALRCECSIFMKRQSEWTSSNTKFCPTEGDYVRKLNWHCTIKSYGTSGKHKYIKLILRRWIWTSSFKQPASLRGNRRRCSGRGLYHAGRLATSIVS